MSIESKKSICRCIGMECGSFYDTRSVDEVFIALDRKKTLLKKFPTRKENLKLVNYKSFASPCSHFYRFLNKFQVCVTSCFASPRERLIERAFAQALEKRKLLIRFWLWLRHSSQFVTFIWKSLWQEAFWLERKIIFSLTVSFWMLVILSKI